MCTPHAYEKSENSFRVFGIFCCWGCAKANLLESLNYLSHERLCLLDNMARDVFGYEGPEIPRSPPRQRLRMFGGDLDYDQFRSSSSMRCTTLSLPFINSPEVYEYITTSHTTEGWTVKGIPSRAPVPPTDSIAAHQQEMPVSLFENFIKDKKAVCTQQSGREDPMVPGTLSAYVKKRKVADDKPDVQRM